MQYETTIKGRLVSFKETPKGYFYLDGKRVSKDAYELKEIMCESFDCLSGSGGYYYKCGKLRDINMRVRLYNKDTAVITWFKGGDKNDNY